MANLNLHITKGETQLSGIFYEKIAPLLESREISEVSNPLDADYRLVLGGDGSALQEARRDLANQNLPPIFGIKAGNKRSRGMFLNSIEIPDSAEEFARIINQSVQEQLYYLHVISEDFQKRIKEIYAFNDISTLRMEAQSAATKILINGNEYEKLQRVMGDGLIISTPQGSTAYNLAAGGIIATSAENVLLTGNNSNYGSLVLPRNTVIDLEMLETEKRPQKLESDGYTIMENVQKIRTSPSEKFSNFAFIPGQSLEEKLIETATQNMR